MDEKTQVRSQSPLRPLHWTRSVRLRVYFSSGPVRIPSNANILRLALVNRVPLGPSTLRAIKITTLGACGLPTNAAGFPQRALHSARRTTFHPSARFGLYARSPFSSEEPLRLTFVT